MDCGGAGKQQKSQTLEVSITAGVEMATVRLCRAKAKRATAVCQVATYVEINVKPHEIFTRNGADLHLDVPINMATAALGDEVEVPTLDGRLKIKIAEGTQSGKMLRVRGKALPRCVAVCKAI